MNDMIQLTAHYSVKQGRGPHCISCGTVSIPVPVTEKTEACCLSHLYEFHRLDFIAALPEMTRMLTGCGITIFSTHWCCHCRN